MRLGEVCESVSQTFRKQLDEVVLINTSDVLDGTVTNHTYVPNENLRGQFKKSFRQNDILYSEIRPQNRRFAFVNFDASDYIASTKLMVVRANELVVPEFLFQVLKSDMVIDQLQQLAETRSGTFPQITFSELAALDVRIPSIDEQRGIAATLRAFDDKIANNTKINHHLEQMAQAIFKSWFVDFEPFGGEMPSDWREGTISDLGNVIGGSTPSKAKLEYYTECGIAWITPKDLSVNKNKFIAHGADDITELGLRNSSARLMPRGTVLFSSRAPIGYIAIASGEVCTNQGFKSIVPNGSIGTAFIYYFLIENLQTIENMASGSTFKEVSGTTMKCIPAIIPDNDTLRRFQDECTPIFEKQELLEAENAQLAEIRDALLPRLMSGELSVADV